MNKNENGEGSQAYLYIRIVKKKCLIFQATNRVLSGKFLAFTKSFSVFSLFQHIKVFFYEKGKKMKKKFFFSFNVFYEHLNIFIVIAYMTV